MTDKLREAMDEVAAALLPGSPLTASAECAAWELAKAYLAEHNGTEELSPPNLSFAAVNEFVHGDTCYEYLQWLCLSLATALDAKADDAEQVTTGWLEDVGFKLNPLHRGCFAISCGDQAFLAMRTINCTWVYGFTDLPDQPARGDVRRLCRALGVELKEPA